MTSTSFAVLEPTDDAQVALDAVDIRACLVGLMSEVVVKQTYRNLEDRNIEAVYTFPLPLNAILLDLTMEINGRKLSGVVVTKSQASEQYEEAIEEGDTAVLLNQTELGLFTMNVANILPGELAVIQFKYTQLHQWSDNSLRLVFPTTLAPWYGDPLMAGLAEHEIPDVALITDCRLSLSIRIEGELSKADLECPNHPVAISLRDDVVCMSLSGNSALMDRDFILIIREPSNTFTEIIYEQDHNGYVALASFQPVLPDADEDKAQSITLLIDCSGSMAGNAIAQAKDALHKVLALLNAKDYFNIIAFGSDFNMLFSEPVKVSQKSILKAANFVKNIDANMGGTELEAALDAAYYSYKEVVGVENILLITDGNIWDQESIILAASFSSQRVFSVGVGMGVSESLIRRIAESSGGACEFVSPKEDMSEGIVRLFKRIKQPPVNSIKTNWTDNPTRELSPESRSVFAGDTLHYFAWFDQLPVGSVDFKIVFDDGRLFNQTLCFTSRVFENRIENENLSRVAAHARLPRMSASDSIELSEKYQLITEHTSCVLVFNREEYQKSADVPALRKVPHMLAAGWGGMGSVMQERSAVRGVGGACSASACRGFSNSSKEDESEGYLDIPAFLRRKDETKHALLIGALNRHYTDASSSHLDIVTIDELVDLGLDEMTASLLRNKINEEHLELSVVIDFLVKLLESEAGDSLSRHLKRIIRKAHTSGTVEFSQERLMVD